MMPIQLSCLRPYEHFPTIMAANWEVHILHPQAACKHGLLVCLVCFQAVEDE